MGPTDIPQDGARRSVLEAEVRGLLGLGLAELGSVIDEPTRELVALLSSDRTTAGFVRDLAEILFLPRAERSEYRDHRLSSQPWVISKLLLEYATRSWRLDWLTGALMKDLCAADCCDRLPVGCCSVLGYDLGLVPGAMLKAQEIEARRNGWKTPEREEKCRYHGERGCVIALFKSPACVGYVCEPLERQLRLRHPEVELSALLGALTRFRNADLDRSEIFALMDVAIAAGADLVRRSGVALPAQFGTI